MTRNKLLLFAVILIIVVSSTIGVYYYMQLQQMSKPSWLKLDDYVVYEQFFVWTEHNLTDYMIWNVTDLRGDLVDLHLSSHGVANVTTEDIELTVGDLNWTINAFTREAVNCSDSSYVGEKWPFWIQTNVGVGSSVDIMYGVNTISGSESIDVFGQQRQCWVLDYNWATATMTRWYDKASGVCLKIHVVLYRDVTVAITETAVQTNVDL
jgi:hypothetical protein